jgi:hypothetical protein
VKGTKRGLSREEKEKYKRKEKGKDKRKGNKSLSTSP